MNKFDRFSLFPFYIDIPLKYAADKVTKDHLKDDQLNHLLKSTLCIPEQPSEVSYEPNKLTIMLQSDGRPLNRLTGYRLKDQTFLLGNNGDRSFVADTSSFSDFNSVEIIQEGDKKLGSDDLQAIISTVLDLMHK